MKLPLFLLLSLTCAVATLSAQQPKPAFKGDDHTVALWNAANGAGGVIEDESSSGVTLKIVQKSEANPPNLVEGRFGKALFFPGKVYFAAEEGGVIETPAAVTLEAWIQLDPDMSEAVERGVFQYAGYQSSGFRMSVDASQHLTWLIETGDREVMVTSRSPLPAGEWIHVAGTYDGKVMRVFVNGEFSAERPLENGKPQGEGAVFLGLVSAAGPPYFRGAIEAVRVSNIARTEFPIP